LPVHELAVTENVTSSVKKEKYQSGFPGYWLLSEMTDLEGFL